MPWVMSILRTAQPPREYHVFIGAVKIAEIVFIKAGHDKWNAVLRTSAPLILETKTYPDMSAALRALHEALNFPPDKTGYDPNWGTRNQVP